jgi:thiamine kinase-like enzyme
VTTADSSRFAAKIYPGLTADGQDRLTVESEALSFMHQHGIECVPQPIVSDSVNQCAVFEFIEGAKVASNEVSEADIDQATQFLASLDNLKNGPDSSQLPRAAEACFSLRDIIDNLDSRLARLEVTGAQGFLVAEFAPAFQRTVEWCEERISSAGESMETELAINDRTLSPSDFGFHNAIRRDDGGLIFLDFEYFGWDDPAKMISDFLLHPAMDLSPNLKVRFVATMAGNNPVLMERLETVYPFFGLKWCLILLNAFLPEYRLQRGLDDSKLAKTLELQTKKAGLMLSTVERAYERFPYRDEEYTVNVS